MSEKCPKCGGKTDGYKHTVVCVGVEPKPTAEEGPFNRPLTNDEMLDNWAKALIHQGKGFTGARALLEYGFIQGCAQGQSAERAKWEKKLTKLFEWIDFNGNDSTFVTELKVVVRSLSDAELEAETLKGEGQ